MARVYTITKEIALTAAKLEAALKDIADQEEAKRDKSKPPLTLQQQIDRACENRRRKWDCFHIATAQVLECEVMYSTDAKLQNRPKQLGLKNLKIIPPPDMTPTITGPLIDGTEGVT
jgi:predicted nucleic acid-binding protein